MTDINGGKPGSPRTGPRAPGEILRDSKGQFRKGSSPNPRGRPRKRPLIVSDRQEAAYFLEADRELVTITLNGRRKKVPAIVAAYQLIRKLGLEGDYRYLKLFVDLRKQFVRYVDEARARKLELLLDLVAQVKAGRQLDDKVADLMNKTLKELDEPYDL